MSEEKTLGEKAKEIFETVKEKLGLGENSNEGSSEPEEPNPGYAFPKSAEVSEGTMKEIGLDVKRKREKYGNIGVKAVLKE